ncbi:MAG: hydantoinase/oxoprolinase family protein [Gammaproteobacteria bacterium]|nr:hydantoinase/oxoprolinase family protein [Gammaproteobacteria bacterium]MDE0512319.1 hydantoinase/oxoprolinase family protein [Gammaproteobacteria bacterium]
MATRIGVDIGGTFTDLLFYNDETSDMLVAKVPTTPASPEQGCVQAVTDSVDGDQLQATQYFLHGTTVGLNSLLERKGARVGLLATRGFRDILEIRRGDRDEMYNLFWQLPEPLVPRRLRLPVTGRVRSDGTVHIAFEKQDVLDVLEIFTGEGVNSIAVAFMNAYANPDHELAAETALREAGFDGEISLSHRISREYREYERTSTTVIDAFVRGRMSNYLRRLEADLRSAGFNGACLITRSGSGSMTFSEAEDRPFETIMSGPVAGAEGGGELSRQLDLGDLITADVGGTSFDTCVITRGRPTLLFEGKIVGMPLQTPWVDVRSIGAGGGSIAQVDVGGLLRVGPESGGADPGPACYGKGGDNACMTDAAYYLGMLGEGKLASGLQLDLSLAEKALQPLAGKLGYGLDDTAIGIMDIASASMADAIREITVEQGIDPRKLKLLAFGGAGPLMSTLLARDLDITEIVIPLHAGNFSAWGLLGADLTRATARTRIMRLDEASLATANDILEEMYSDLAARAGSSGGGDEWAREVGLDMRYKGQEHTLSINVPGENGRVTISTDQVREIFTRDYDRTFGNTMDEPVEIVSIRATVRHALPRRTEGPSALNGSGGIYQDREAYSFTEKKRMNFRILDRSSMQVGDTLAGPAIINEPTATTYLDANWDCEVHGSGCLFISRR